MEPRGWIRRGNSLTAYILGTFYGVGVLHSKASFILIIPPKVSQNWITLLRMSKRVCDCSLYYQSFYAIFFVTLAAKRYLLKLDTRFLDYILYRYSYYIAMIRPALCFADYGPTTYVMSKILKGCIFIFQWGDLTSAFSLFLLS